MKRKKIFFVLLCFTSTFCLGLAILKFGLIVHALPIGGVSWVEIIDRFPTLFILSSVMAYICFRFFKLLEQQGQEKINAANERINNKYKYCSPSETFECRVCGYSNSEYPWGKNGYSPNYQICKCCGSQFGKDDITLEDIKRKREEWINKGYQWYVKEEKNNTWDFDVQLEQVPDKFK